VSESQDSKARELLWVGKLTVHAIGRDSVLATCDSSTAAGVTYQLGWVNGKAFCSCPASKLCVHLMGLARVVKIPKTEEE